MGWKKSANWKKKEILFQEKYWSGLLRLIDGLPKK
jgi:hypothetical protein